MDIAIKFHQAIYFCGKSDITIRVCIYVQLAKWCITSSMCQYIHNSYDCCVERMSTLNNLTRHVCTCQHTTIQQFPRTYLCTYCWCWVLYLNSYKPVLTHNSSNLLPVLVKGVYSILCTTCKVIYSDHRLPEIERWVLNYEKGIHTIILWAENSLNM